MDPTRLRQILMNLVSNAIKFSEPGGVVVLRLGQRPASQGERAFFLEVEDQGIGMTEAQVGQLFTPFQQADSSTTRKFGGTGLGLSITRHLIEAMGGLIAVRSELGWGSRFHVEIPLPAADANLLWLAAEESASPPALKSPQPDQSSGQSVSGKILLADDSPDNRRVLLYHLRRLGFDVEMVGDGRRAVEKALSGAFDLVLMDMQMPELDGYSASRALRLSGYTVPIIALTAHAMPEDREKCLAAGCSDYLSKPIDVKVLAKVLATHLSRPAIGASSQAPIGSTCLGGGDVILSDFHQDDGMAPLITEYVEALPGQVADLRLLLERGEILGLESLAHMIKGVGGMYGYPCLTETASLIEQAAQEGQDAGLLRELVEEIATISAKIERGMVPTD